MPEIKSDTVTLAELFDMHLRHSLNYIPYGLDGSAAVPIKDVTIRGRSHGKVILDGAPALELAISDTVQVAWEEPTPEEERQRLVANTLHSLRFLAETDLETWEQQRLSAAAILTADNAAVRVGRSMVDSLIEGSRQALVARVVLDILDSSDSDEEKLRRLRKTAHDNSLLTYVPSSTWLLYNAAAWGRIYARVDQVE